MGELFELSVSGANLPFTIMLGLVILYWVGVILGALDIELFDFDLDLDGDADIDVDADAGAVGGGGIARGAGGFAGSIPVGAKSTPRLAACASAPDYGAGHGPLNHAVRV